MNARSATATAAVAGALVVGLAGCHDSGGLAAVRAGSPSGHCSDPNPSYVSLTFAGVVCVDRVLRVRQPDGSTELAVRVSVTNKDPNTFGVRSWDFEVLDSAGHDVSAEDAGSAGRRGVGRCDYQQEIVDDGWPLRPGATFTIPGALCFNLAAGEQPAKLVWQGDVSVPLAPR